MSDHTSQDPGTRVFTLSELKEKALQFESQAKNFLPAAGGKIGELIAEHLLPENMFGIEMFLEWLTYGVDRYDEHGELIDGEGYTGGPEVISV